MSDAGIAMPLVDAALAYRTAGMSVIATRAEKAPAMTTWEYFKTNIASDEQIAAMFMSANAAGVGIVCGGVSGNLECLDFDDGDAAWDEWSRVIEEDHPGLLSRLVMERSPSGGRHLLYRVPDMTIPVGKKLARRPGLPGEKNIVCVIETRGEKQYFCACPTPGYTMIQGDLRTIPAIAPDEREAMRRLAMAFDRMPEPEEMPRPPPASVVAHGRPGDDYNRRGDVREVLQRHGWTHARTIGDNEQWRRPGKDKGISATLRTIDGVDVFFVFSTSTLFDAMRGYSPFQVYSMLEHGGDYSRAAAELQKKGYGQDGEDTFDIDAFLAAKHILPNERMESQLETLLIDAEEWIQESETPPDPVLVEIFEKGDKLAIIGPSKTRKSFFTQQLSICIATGQNFLGISVSKPRKVVMAQFEIRPPHYHRRLKRMTKSMGVEPHHISGRLKIANMRGKKLDQAMSEVAEFGPDVLIIDPLYKVYGADHDENSAGDTADLMAKFDEYAEKIGCAVVMVHHDSKAGSGNMPATSRGAGSGLFARDYDASLLLTPHANESDALVLQSKLRNYPPKEICVISWIGAHFLLTPEIPPIMESYAKEQVKTRSGMNDDDIADIAESWFNGEEMWLIDFQEEIKDKFSAAKRQIDRVVDKLKARGFHIYRPEGNKGSYKIAPP